MITFQIPGGPMNLATLFPGVDFTKVEEYYLELRNQADDAVIITTPAYKRSCCCGDDIVRIFFVNYLGSVDAINFKILLINHEPLSAQWKKPLQTPMQKWNGGIQRFNVTANDTYTVENNCYQEEDQDYLQELMDSPNAWIQWFGTQGQDNDYLPIVIKDAGFAKRKSEERYNYVLQLQFVMANEKLILRN